MLGFIMVEQSSMESAAGRRAHNPKMANSTQGPLGQLHAALADFSWDFI